MPPYLYALPQTGTVILGGSLFIDPSNSYSSHLAQASQARTRLQLALKAAEAAKTSDGAAVGVIDACQGYLPYLRGIQSCLDSDLLLWKTDPTFPWQSSLTAYSLSPPLLYYPSLQADELFVLVAYALALNNYARLILDSLPVGALGTGGGGSLSVAAQRLTADEEKRTATGLARAVDLLCQAAGVMQWAADNVCPAVESARAASGRLGKGKIKWPAETGAEACRGLSMTFLADAHIVAIRKLCLPIISHSLFAPPGPPLPTAHPSPSLLAKLYTHVSTLYSSASAHLLAHSSSSSPFASSGRDTRTKAERERDASDVDGEIIAPLSRYLRKEGVLSTAMSFKWYGVDAGENGKGARVGEALAWVKEARSKLEELEDGKLREKMKGLSFGRNKEKSKEERKARKGRVEREGEDAEAWIRAYQKMNDTVAFQPVPLASTLTRPEGRPILNAKPFKPPPPKMGAPEEGQESTAAPEEYAGKGNYF